MNTDFHFQNRNLIEAAAAMLGERSESGARSTLEDDLAVAEPRDGRGADCLQSVQHGGQVTFLLYPTSPC